MKATLIPQEVFTLQVGGHQIEGMRVASKWNGLIELRNAAGETLIVSAPEACQSAASIFASVFSGVFRTAEETAAAGTTIVMGSPSILERLRLAQPPAPDSPSA